MIGSKVRIAGSAKGAQGWIRVDEASLGYDHATRFSAEHALRLDFVDTTTPGSEHVAIELDFASGRALLAQLRNVIDAAERSGVAE